ncbi:MAG TPA: DUF58 domain-containing protein [Dissulfurispiraceae bacterium]|nr:DUF58 domain-containing protein [Dissulfurispiraceae bacterium]
MRLRVRIEPPDEIYAGTVMPLKVVIINDKRFMPSFLIRVMAGDSKILFPVVDKSSRESALISISFPRRGRYTIDDIYVSSVFPFNFFVRFRRIDSVLETVVFPAARKCSLQSLYAADRKAKGDRTLDRTGFESEILSIRNYQYGDPQKYIHWKATARTGHLKTKELSSLAHRPLIIDFDKVAVSDLEEKISCITYAIIRSFRLNTPVGLKIAGKVFSHASNSQDAGGLGKLAMLRELALYGTERK